MKPNYFKKALSYLRWAFKIYNKQSEHDFIEVARIAFLTCHMEIYQRERVESYLHESRKITNDTFAVIAATAIDEIAFNCNLGRVLFNAKQYKKALSFFKLSLGIALSKDSLKDKEHDAILLYSGIGTCLLKLDKYKESLSYLNFSITLAKKLECNEDFRKSTFNLAATYNNLGKCLVNIQQHVDAWPYLIEAFKIGTEGYLDDEEYDKRLFRLAEKSILHKRKLKELARIIRELGLWYLHLNCYKEALNYLQQSFNIYKKLSNAKMIVATRAELLTCYMQIYQHENVEK